MNDKLYVSETIDVCIEGELKDVRATIDNLISVYGESAYLEADNDYTSLVYNRLETDQEYKRRKTEEFKKEEKQRQKDLKQYESLKKKLGL